MSLKGRNFHINYSFGISGIAAICNTETQLVLHVIHTHQYKWYETSDYGIKIREKKKHKVAFL